MAEVLTPYSTATPYFSGKPPGFASDEDVERLQAYQTYEEMYWGESTIGIEVEDGDPIRVPTTRIIIEAIHRFLAVGWDFNVIGSGAEKDNATVAFKKLFKREEIRSKVSSAKRWGLVRGDAMLHVIADPSKPAGSRLIVEELDPGTYFPIYDDDDQAKIVGCHIVDQFVIPGSDDVIARRITYRKSQDDSGAFTGRVTSAIAAYELAGWDDRSDGDIKLLAVIQEETELPPQITALPVYHWRNTRNTGYTFGSSAIRGIEKVLKAIDQVVTDEDISLALTSLGVYATDSGEPDGGWVIGPARVVNLQKDTDFKRVAGITSVQPNQDHITYLENKARAGAGVPSIAAGDVDVASAESGVALALKLMPLLAANAERELDMIAVLDHMLFDLQTMWFPAYEGLSFGENVIVESTVNDPMPVNRQATLDEIVMLWTNDLITIDMAIQRLESIGWSFPEGAASLLLTQMSTKATATDAFAARLADEEAVTDATDTDPDM
jgi:hypothetical protein